MSIRTRPHLSSGLAEYLRLQGHRLCFLWLGVVGLRTTPLALRSVYSDPRLQLALAEHVMRTFGADFAHPLDHGSLLSEVYGMPLRESDDDFPLGLASILSATRDVSGLNMPDPRSEPAMVRDLDSLALICRSTERPVYVSLEGPFTFAADLLGMEHLLRAVIRDSGLVREVMEFATGVVASYAAAVSQTGVDLVIVSEPMAAVISPGHFQDHVLESCRTVLDAVTCWKGMHICGDVGHLVDHMLAAGAEVLSLEKEIDFPSLAERLPDTAILLGNVDPLAFLEPTPARMEQLTRALLESMQGVGAFIVAPGCDLPPATPPATVTAFVRLVHEWEG